LFDLTGDIARLRQYPHSVAHVTATQGLDVTRDVNAKPQTTTRNRHQMP